ncbi:hypothetical protein GRS48_08310 [Halorubrum sp. JWXQ-INN 858]|uniref:YIP1 family protein n=1 Tax=Halorubrum sp. JWXQ-INN 858 TaxID=2690782 RepID=UPI0013FB31B7|nr:YIP1 family protein [Halorubrum sp. JWXQ-INN 858]MWV64824.1 hypothetical protein [Halorubrum sp. JWXQ-INN 858]
MSTWTETPGGGRRRGPRGLARAWVAVLVRPRRFFATGVRPGDQAPGLTFAVVVAAAFTLGWLLADPGAIPAITESAALSAVVVLLVVIALAAPVGLHLTAAVATLSLLVASIGFDDGLGLRDRGGVSETVQVVAYASAPMALAGPPIAGLRIACATYATVLVWYGIRAVHGTTALRATVAGLPPAIAGYWIGYRALAAARSLVGV